MYKIISRRAVHHTETGSYSYQTKMFTNNNLEVGKFSAIQIGKHLYAIIREEGDVLVIKEE